MGRNIPGHLRPLSGTVRRAHDGKTARPFDVTEYTAATDSLSTAAEEIKQLLADTREIVDSGILSPTLNQDEIRGRGLTDHAVWRAGQGASVIFVLLLLYRLGRRRRVQNPNP